MGRGSRRGRRYRGAEAEAPTASLSEDLERLNGALGPYGLDFDATAQARILRFAGDLVLWNDRLNLLSRNDVQNVISKHVASSMGVLLLTTAVPGSRWIDIGTGAGFPGMVLKIARPELSLDLLDSARKRCIFLEEVRRGLELGPMPILQLRAETMLSRGEGVGQYDIVTSRAVASLEDSLRVFGPFARPGGRYITFKGPQWSDEIGALEKSGIPDQTGFSLEANTRVPWSVGHILCFRKRQ